MDIRECQRSQLMKTVFLHDRESIAAIPLQSRAAILGLRARRLVLELCLRGEGIPRGDGGGYLSTMGGMRHRLCDITPD